MCANAGSDHLSVIDTQSDAVVETIWAKPKPSDLLGASPNAVAFDASGKRLYVANGSQNAIAVFEFEPEEPGESKLAGMIPVGWYPGALAIDAGGTTVVAANIKGLPKAPGKPTRRRERAPGLQLASVLRLAVDRADPAGR